MILIIVCILLLILGRVFYVISMISQRRSKVGVRRRLEPAKIAVIMGSGGHTAEMLRIVDKLNFANYNPRLYIMADSDKSSETKIISLEKHASLVQSKTSYSIYRIPRSRDVNQSYMSSVFSTIYSFLFSIPLLLRERPDLIICNGPGTCVPICVIVFLMKVMWICDCKIVYIESICRVKTLSLTGKMVLYFVDEFFVQWQDLHNMYRNTKYIGCLV